MFLLIVYKVYRSVILSELQDSSVLDDICGRLQQVNIFTVARRNVEGQELLYHSSRFCNDIWVLSELKIQPGSSSVAVRTL